MGGDMFLGRNLRYCRVYKCLRIQRVWKDDPFVEEALEFQLHGDTQLGVKGPVAIPGACSGAFSIEEVKPKYCACFGRAGLVNKQCPPILGAAWCGRCFDSQWECQLAFQHCTSFSNLLVKETVLFSTLCVPLSTWLSCNKSFFSFTLAHSWWHLKAPASPSPNCKNSVKRGGNIAHVGGGAKA